MLLSSVHRDARWGQHNRGEERGLAAVESGRMVWKIVTWLGVVCVRSMTAVRVAAAAAEGTVHHSTQTSHHRRSGSAVHVRCTTFLIHRFTHAL